MLKTIDDYNRLIASTGHMMAPCPKCGMREWYVQTAFKQGIFYPVKPIALRRICRPDTGGCGYTEIWKPEVTHGG